METSIFYKSPLGALNIIATNTAITKVSFVNSLQHPLTDEQTIKYVNPSHDVLRLCIRQLDAYFEGTLRTFDLPLAQPGTEFQQSVWQQLQQIPFGKTYSYLQLSKQLGNVKAIRAVGTANGKNNIAIIVPCHRVIGSNGTLVGYAGDLWRKKWLLEHEGTHANGLQTLF